MYDVIIIGAGPAGISAGIYAVSRGRKTLILEKEEVGGVIGKVSTVTHYSGIIEQETGKTFADRLKKQAVQSGVEIKYEEVKNVKLTGDIKIVSTDTAEYQAPKIILANGTTPRKLGIPGESELAGKGIGTNAAIDGPSFSGKNIYVIGGADGAVKEAIYLAQFAKKLTIIHFENTLGCIAEFKNKIKQLPNVSVLTNSRLKAVYGTNQIEKIDILSENDGKITTIEDEGCGIFIYAGSTPNTELYKELSLSDGYIPVNEKMETSINGVYAAGDICVKQVRQAATAVSDGAIVGINAAII